MKPISCVIAAFCLLFPFSSAFAADVVGGGYLVSLVESGLDLCLLHRAYVDTAGAHRLFSGLYL